MANLITAGRILLLFVAVALLYSDTYLLIFLSGILIAVVILADGLDGWVARRRKSTSELGAVLDIAGDRVVENVLWVVFAHLHLIPVWVPLVVITRSFIVDVVRAAMLSRGMTPFGENTMMRSSLSRFLTSGRFSRAYYGWSKGFAFVLLAWMHAWELDPDRFLGAAYDTGAFHGIVWFIVYSSVAICVIRGLPVLYDALYYFREDEESAAAAVEELSTDLDVTAEQAERGGSIS
ncbi:MAG: CDP-alcohol phosphatidyltransferase family protein [Thermomicrobiales bacterium]